MSSLSLWQRIPLAFKILGVGLLILAAVILLKPRPEPHPETKVPRPQVNVAYAQPQTLALDVTTQGTVSPQRQIDLISQVSGQIIRVADNFLTGGFFAAGDMLIEIDPRDYQYSLIRAEARISETERTLASEHGLARQAKREWRDLGDTDANALFLRKPQLAAAEAQVAAAKAERDQAQLNLERTKVYAPFAGRMQQTLVNLGQHLTPGTRIATIYDSSVAEIRLPLTDQDSQLIDLPLGITNKTRQHPEVILRGVIASEAHQWHGKVTRTDASLDPQSRMYHALVEVPEPFNTERWPAPLLMGMYVQATISGKPLNNVIQLPKSSIFRRDQIYSINNENKVQLKTVRILHSDATHVWVQGDLQQGEPVVVDRQGYLNPGVLVDIVTSKTEPTGVTP